MLEASPHINYFTTNPPLKRCYNCKQEKPVTEFYRDRYQSSGYTTSCKVCRIAGCRPIPRDGHQFCSTCGQEKPLNTEHFGLSKTAKSGFRGVCKECRKLENIRDEEKNAARRKLYYQKNRERLVEYQRQYRLSYPDLLRMRKRAYYEANFPRIQERQRINREKNHDKYALHKHNYYISRREYFRAKGREYQRNNPHVYIAIAHRRRARKKALPATFTGDHWKLCLVYWGGCCAVCRKPLRDLFGDVKPNADHWIPLSHTDCIGTTPDNMICLCSDCNLSKADVLPDVWIKRHYGKRKALHILDRIRVYFEWIVKQ